MKKKMFFILVFLIPAILFSQIKIKSNQPLYLELQNGKIKVSYEKADKIKYTSNKDNQTQVYFKWINPLKYKLIWKDSTYSDKKDSIILSFQNAILSLINLKPTEIKTKGGSEDDLKKMGKLGKAVKDNNLAILQFQLSNCCANLDSNDLIIVSNFFNEVRNIEKTIINSDIKDAAQKQFSNLLKMDKFNEVSFNSSKEILSDLKDNANYNNDTLNTKKTLLTNRIFKDKNLEIILNFAYNTFLEKVQDKINKDNDILDNLKQVTKIFEDSRQYNSLSSEYFLVKDISFKDGEVLLSQLTIEERSYNNDMKLIKGKKELDKATFQFQKYSNFNLYSSAGIFYSNKLIDGFKVGSENNTLKVEEDNIKGGKPLSATFINLEYQFEESFAPSLQIGIDPTKKRPFLLVGGGLSFPKYKFSLTGGACWTWKQNLKTLTLGQTISSTSELDNDIQYKFDKVPGYYLGIQYNINQK